MVQLAESSKFAPAFTAFQGKLFLAWTGSDPQGSLNILSSSDGVTFGNKVTLHESSLASPSLCVWNDRLYLAWTGKDANKSINILSSSDGITFGNKVTLHESSIAAPSLYVFDGQLFMAWTGVDSDTLGLINIAISGDGTTFPNKYTLFEKIPGGPALAGDRDCFGGTIILAWIGSDSTGNTNLAGDPHSGGFLNLTLPNLDPLSSKATANGRLTTSVTCDVVGSPSLITREDEAGFTLGCVEQGSHSLILIEGKTYWRMGIIGIPSLTIFEEKSIAAPVFLDWITNSQTVSYVAWTGTDAGNSLNVAPLKELHPSIVG